MFNGPLRQKDFLVFICLGFLIYGVVVVAEKITITSYYPSPYGAYRELRSTQNSYFATQSGKMVGIGTITPSSALTIDAGATNGASGGAVHLKGSDSPLVRITNTGTGRDWAAISSNEGSLLFSDIGVATRMIIDGNGNVGIGSSAPAAKLHVQGAAEITGGISVGSEWEPSADTHLATKGYVDAQGGKGTYTRSCSWFKWTDGAPEFYASWTAQGILMSAQGGDGMYGCYTNANVPACDGVDTDLGIDCTPTATVYYNNRWHYIGNCTRTCLRQ
ncbi:hypothetical protein ACFL6Y_05340 [Elusimicrobiota bacterium]